MSDAEGTLGLSSTAISSLRYDRLLDREPLDPFESDAIICGLVPLKSRVLDVGCGTGVLLSLLKSLRHADCVGIEPNEARAAEARHKGHDVLTGIADPETLRRLGLFDVVLFADVLEHLVDPHAVLTLVMRALKPGGVVIASLPNVAHWSVRSALLAGRFDYQPSGIMDATHLRWFTQAGAERLFAAAGFRVETVSHSLGFWMKLYSEAPWRYIPRRLRKIIARAGLKAWPRLFGCQHVMSAKPMSRPLMTDRELTQ